MASIPKLAILVAVFALTAGCEQTIDSPTPTAQNQQEQLPLDMTPRGGNSALGGAMRAAERTEDKINDYQERLNRQMEEE